MQAETNISEEHTAFVFRAEDVPSKHWFLPTSPHNVD
jgi:hypothetical protein